MQLMNLTNPLKEIKELMDYAFKQSEEEYQELYQSLKMKIHSNMSLSVTSMNH